MTPRQPPAHFRYGANSCAEEQPSVIDERGRISPLSSFIEQGGFLFVKIFFKSNVK